MIARPRLVAAIVALLLAGGAFAYHHHILSRELHERNNDAWAWFPDPTY